MALSQERMVEIQKKVEEYDKVRAQQGLKTTAENLSRFPEWCFAHASTAHQLGISGEELMEWLGQQKK